MPVLSESPSNSLISGGSRSRNVYIFCSVGLIFIFFTHLLQQRLKKSSIQRQQAQQGNIQSNYRHPASPAKSSNNFVPVTTARMSSALPEKRYSSPGPLQNRGPPTASIQSPPSRSQSQEGRREVMITDNQPSHSAALENPPVSFQFENPSGGSPEFSLAKSRIPRPPHPTPAFKPLILGASFSGSSMTGSGQGSGAASGPATSTSLIHPEPPSPSIISITALPPRQLSIQTSNAEESLPQEYYQMTFVPSPTEYTSFEALYSQNPPYHELEDSSSALPPRRRSYTKSLSNGSEVAGEIVVSSSGVEGQQWRRHTRVFGGGVCKACEESERRMSA